jgi:hypothetical protein
MGMLISLLDFGRNFVLPGGEASADLSALSNLEILRLSEGSHKNDKITHL